MNWQRTLISVLGVTLVAGCGGTTSPDYKIAETLSKEMTCPEPAKKEYRAWGKSGTSVVCRIDHGPFVAIEGHLRIRGQYENGRQVGRWRFYDKEGNVYKEVDYSDGKEPPPLTED